MAKFLLRKISLSLLALSMRLVETGSRMELPSVNRIVDGSHIDITKVPYMVSYKINGRYACAGAILNREWGMTAAHCAVPVLEDPSASLSIRSGSNRHDKGGTLHNVTILTYHEKYNEENSDYDIAVFKVHPPFHFNNARRPVKLPESYKSVNTTWGLVAGWGYFIDADPILSQDLQYVILPKVDRATCRKEYEDRYDVTNRQVCYGFFQGGKDACKGDSGSPLINNFTAIGITSWGADCGEPDSPGVYTDVIALVDWIKNKTTCDR